MGQPSPTHDDPFGGGGGVDTVSALTLKADRAPMARPATGVASHGRAVSRRAIGREVQDLGRRAASRPRAPLEWRRHQPQERLGSAPVQTTALGARPVANRPAPTASESHGPSPGARAQQPRTRQWPIAVIPAPAPAPPLHHCRSRTPRPAGVSRRPTWKIMAATMHCLLFVCSAPSSSRPKAVVLHDLRAARTSRMTRHGGGDTDC